MISAWAFIKDRCGCHVLQSIQRSTHQISASQTEAASWHLNAWKTRSKSLCRFFMLMRDAAALKRIPEHASVEISLLQV